MQSTRQFFRDALGWGFILWLIGYVLGIVFFFIVPKELIGWVISPIAIVITLWILYRKIKSPEFNYYLIIAICWTVLAVVLDYLFIVQLFKPDDGYYKTDVYLYYAWTFLLPLIAGLWKKSKHENVER